MTGALAAVRGNRSPDLRTGVSPNVGGGVVEDAHGLAVPTPPSWGGNRRAEGDHPLLAKLGHLERPIPTSTVARADPLRDFSPEEASHQSGRADAGYPMALLAQRHNMSLLLTRSRLTAG